MKTITIGRASDSTIVVDNDLTKVSHTHAELTLNNGMLTFTDHSTNGSYINGQLLHNGQATITTNDKISLANEYDLSWNTVFEHIPELLQQTANNHRATERFNPADLAQGRKTEMFNPDNIGYGDQGNSGSNATVRITPDNKTNGFISAQYSTGSISSKGVEKKIIGKENAISQKTIDDTLDNLNLGAFLASWVWAFANGIKWPALIVLIAFVPYLGIVSSLFLCTYLAINGNRMAWENYSGNNIKNFMHKQRRWRIPGAIIFVAFAILQIVAHNFIINNLY